jgi:hypothetical protein
MIHNPDVNADLLSYGIQFIQDTSGKQLIPWEETRKVILSMDDMIKLVLKCLKCENNRIIFVSLKLIFFT